MPHTVAASVDAARLPDASADLAIAPDRSSAILRVRGMPRLPDDRVYQVWIKRGQTIEPDALFRVDRSGRGSAAVDRSLDDADAVMVTREPAAGSRDAERAAGHRRPDLTAMRATRRAAPAERPLEIRVRCGPTVSSGRAADAKPARKTDQRSVSAAAASSAPPATAAGRERRAPPATTAAPAMASALAARVSTPGVPWW